MSPAMEATVTLLVVLGICGLLLGWVVLVVERGYGLVATLAITMAPVLLLIWIAVFLRAGGSL